MSDDDPTRGGIEPEKSPESQRIQERYGVACVTLIRKAFPNQDWGLTEPLTHADIQEYIAAKIDYNLDQLGVMDVKTKKNTLDEDIKRLVALQDATETSMPEQIALINAGRSYIQELKYINTRIRGLDEILMDEAEGRQVQMPAALLNSIEEEIRYHEEATESLSPQIEDIDMQLERFEEALDEQALAQYRESIERLARGETANEEDIPMLLNAELHSKVTQLKRHAGLARSLTHGLMLYESESTTQTENLRSDRYSKQEKKASMEAYDTERQRLAAKAKKGDEITKEDIYAHLRQFATFYVSAFPKGNWKEYYDQEIQQSIDQGGLTEEASRLYDEAIHFNNPEETGRQEDEILSKQVLLVLEQSKKLFDPPESN